MAARMPPMGGAPSGGARASRGVIEARVLDAPLHGGPICAEHAAAGPAGTEGLKLGFIARPTDP
eukprot:11833707-Alexandrium_andersonii.AAC.1